MRVQEGRDAGEGIDMSSKDVHAGPPRAQCFHPEFGYFCPSAQMRRKVRSFVLTIAAGLSIAAGTALALAPQLAPQPSRDGLAAASVLSDTAVSPSARSAELVNGADSGGAGESLPVVTAHASAATDRVAGSRAQASCDDPSGAFLAPQCQLGKTRKSHMTRAARASASRVATVPFGDAGLEAEPENVAAARPSRAAETDATAFAVNEAPPLPRARPAAPARKPITTAQKQAPSRDATSADPPAAASSPGFDLFSLFHAPSRTGGGAWAMSWLPRPPAR